MLQNKKSSSEYIITKKLNGLEIALAQQNPNPKDVEVLYIDAIEGFIIKSLDGRLPFLGTAVLTYYDNILVRIYFKGDERLFSKVNKKKKEDEEVEATLDEKIQFMDKIARDNYS